MGRGTNPLLAAGPNLRNLAEPSCFSRPTLPPTSTDMFWRSTGVYRSPSDRRTAFN